MITLDDIAGYCTEKAIWTLLKDIAVHLQAHGPAMITAHDVTLVDDNIRIVGHPEPCDESQAVWHLGAMASYLSSGHHVFGGKGPAYQAKHSSAPLPVLRREHSALTPTVQDCLRPQPKQRISLHDIIQRADSALADAQPGHHPSETESSLPPSSSAPLPDPLKDAWPESFSRLAALLLIILSLSASPALLAQSRDHPSATTLSHPAPADPFLRRYVDIVLALKLPNRTPAHYQRAVDTLSSPRFPKLALLDDIGNDPAEFRGPAANPFRLSSVVVQAYERQQGVENSRGYYYDSRQRGIHYSMIEKCIAAKSTAHYSIRQHSGPQEIVIIPFVTNQSYQIHLFCRGQEIKGQLALKPDTYLLYAIPDVSTNDEISIVIENLSAVPLSFAILNYNARKK